MPIGSYHPDFTNINGQKKIIEFYGTTSHMDPTKYKSNDIGSYNIKARDKWKSDAKRTRFLKSKGYGILVVWYKDLKDIEKLKKKILKFNNK